MSRKEVTKTTTTKKHILVQVDIQLDVRPGGSALPEERTRSVGWVFTGCTNAVWRASNARRKPATRGWRNGRVTPTTTFIDGISTRQRPVVGSGRTRARASRAPFPGPFLCSQGCAYVRPKEASDASIRRPRGCRVLHAPSPLPSLPHIDAPEHLGSMRARGLSHRKSPLGATKCEPSVATCRKGGCQLWMRIQDEV